MSDKLSVTDLADHMDLSPAVVRQKLRDHNIKKDGKSYEWGSKKEMAAVAGKIASGPVSAKPKPSKKGGKKGAKKAPAKKSLKEAA